MPSLQTDGWGTAGESCSVSSGTPTLVALEEILHSGQTSCNHVDEVWPNLFLGDMFASHDRYGLWKLGITHVLNAAHEYIHTALNTPGARIFVHCAVGVSRSATLVLAYLMIYHHFSLVDAIQKVKENRWIFPNRGFLNQLRTLDINLRKERMHESDGQIT
ncbi:hypothetical protein AAFF_G00139160 [Aldrovandia affinis]|uniref:Dual specificity protein phosphatase n=1 Tax=Aldrovandia affinis TaxID=143900 RepID=A0AAD7TCN9_9TELE|nr:hypothetical protein AAFF_G00139160 [Aldrovandia affinis]